MFRDASGIIASLPQFAQFPEQSIRLTEFLLDLILESFHFPLVFEEPRPGFIALRHQFPDALGWLSVLAFHWS